jgi:cation transport protein ChaC
VSPNLRETTLRYLRDREQVTLVYLERIVPITLESGERVRAVTYVADRLHPQYAGRLERDVVLGLVLAGAGRSGRNGDYVANTYSHLVAMGIRDRELKWLDEKLRFRSSNSDVSTSLANVSK